MECAFVVLYCNNWTNPGYYPSICLEGLIKPRIKVGQHSRCPDKTRNWWNVSCVSGGWRQPYVSGDQVKVIKRSRTRPCTVWESGNNNMTNTCDCIQKVSGLNVITKTRKPFRYSCGFKARFVVAKGACYIWQVRLSVLLSVRLSAFIRRLLLDTSSKFNVGDFYESLSRNSKFVYNRTKL